MAYCFKTSRRVLTFGEVPAVMGILNVTPDSFSDGGCYADVSAAVRHGKALAAAGAWVIDVGGESTRPGHVPVDAEEEQRRVVPVIRELSMQLPGVPLSVDTTKLSVAQAAVAAGAEILNDVEGLEDDFDGKCELLRRSGCGVVIMCGRKAQRSECSVVEETVAYLRSRAEACLSAGVSRECIMLDPGIGFGPSWKADCLLLDGLPQLVELGYPVLLGISRKSFLGKLGYGDTPEGRLRGTLWATERGWKLGACLHRVHDVYAVGNMLKSVSFLRE